MEKESSPSRRALACLWLVLVGGCDPYFLLADPSPDAAGSADVRSDRFPPDAPDATLPEDRPAPDDVSDVQQDAVPPTEVDPGADVPGDPATDEAGPVDREDVPPDGSPEASLSDGALDGDAALDAAPDAFAEPDGAPDDADAASEDATDADHAEPADAAIDGADAHADLADGDAGDAGDEADADAAPVPDAGDAGPEGGISITYRARNGSVVIPSGPVTRILVSFGMRLNVSCMPTAETGGIYRCTIPESSFPSGAETATGLWLAIANACGIDTGLSCTGWDEMWTVTWRGSTYDASSRRLVDGGSEPVFGLQTDRDVCFAQMGYYNHCVRLRP